MLLLVNLRSQNHEHEEPKSIHFLFTYAFYMAFDFSLLINAPVASRVNFLWGTMSIVTPDHRSQHPISGWHDKRITICLTGGLPLGWLHVSEKKNSWYWLSLKICRNSNFLKSIYSGSLRVFSISSFSLTKRKHLLLAMTIFLPLQDFRSFHSFKAKLF